MRMLSNFIKLLKVTLYMMNLSFLFVIFFLLRFFVDSSDVLFDADRNIKCHSLLDNLAFSG